MTENEISKIILDCAFKVHTKLGSGLLEKVYRQALAYELNKYGLIAEQEVVVPVYYELKFRMSKLPSNYKGSKIKLFCNNLIIND